MSKERKTMNFITNRLNTSIAQTAKDQIIAKGFTVKQYLQQLINDADQNSYFDVTSDMRAEMVAAGIEANNVVFNEQVKLLNTDQHDLAFKTLRNLFVINCQDIQYAPNDKVGFVTYHYLENDLLLEAIKSFTEIAELNKELSEDQQDVNDFKTNVHVVDGVYYTPAGIINPKNLTMTICMPIEMLEVVAETATTGITLLTEKLEQVPELKAAVETMYQNI